jgi:putative phosphoesterase
MRIALLSDIHANLPALVAVLDDVQGQEISEIWNLGDLIGYNPFPDDVVRMLQSLPNVTSIVGNYDLKVLAFGKNQSKWKGIKSPAKFFSFQWTAKHISRSTRAFIKKLPQQLRREVEGSNFLLTHGSPAANDESLLPETPEERFQALAKIAQADVVLFGHSHRFFTRKSDGVIFINPGSVGRSFDGDYRASYAVLDISPGKVDVTNRRVEYNLKRNIEQMTKERFPEELIRSISLGRSLDDLPTEDDHASADVLLKKVLEFGQKCRYEKEHSHQVTKVALLLFDQLSELHQFGLKERFLLQSAALLHDIGWIYGRTGHHKASRDLILQAEDLPFSDRDKLLIALIARYHRRAKPKDTHTFYGELRPREKEVVNKLAALLRVADGLDIRHVNAVIDLTSCVLDKKVVVKVKAKELTEEDIKAAKDKADLFAAVFHKEFVVE